MRNRIVWLIVGSALACVLALAGTGVIFAAAHGRFSAGSVGSATQAAAVQVGSLMVSGHQAFFFSQRMSLLRQLHFLFQVSYD